MQMASLLAIGDVIFFGGGIDSKTVIVSKAVIVIRIVVTLVFLLLFTFTS